MKPFGKRDKVGYLLSSMGHDLLLLFVDTYAMLFFTLGLYVDPKHIAIIFFFARLWDALNDPLIGMLPDKIKLSRKSTDKFKPWIKVFVWPFAIFGMLTMLNVVSFTYSLKLVWVASTYIIFSMAYTATSIPYGAQANVITNDPVQRTELSSMRGLAPMVVMIPISILMPLIGYEGNTFLTNIWSITTILLSGMGIVLMLFGQKMVTERVTIDIKTTQSVKLHTILKDTFLFQRLLW